MRKTAGGVTGGALLLASNPGMALFALSFAEALLSGREGAGRGGYNGPA